MKASIIVHGRWHTFDLARELHKNGQLGQLITPYPRAIVRRYGIPGENIVSLTWYEVLRRLSQRLPRRLSQPFQIALVRLFALRAAQLLKPCDIVDAWGDVATPAFEKAARWSSLRACESASAHILDQERLLREEAQRYNVAWQPTPESFVKWRLSDYRLAEVMVVPSRFVKQSFVDHGFNAENVVHVPFGADLSKFTPAEKPPDQFRVGFVGALSLRKGVIDLVNAFQSARLPGAELWLAGRIEVDMDNLLPAPTPSIKRLGHVPHSNIAGVMRQLSLLVVPSIEDGFAMVVAEALACGVPVICSANTGGKDLLGDEATPIAEGVAQYPAGFVVPIRRPDCLELCLRRFHDSPVVQRSMRQAALETASHGMDWADHAQSWAAQLGSLLARGGSIPTDE